MKFRFPKFASAKTSSSEKGRLESALAQVGASTSKLGKLAGHGEKQEVVFGPAEVDEFNAATLGYLRGLSLAEMQRRVAEVSVKEITSAAGIDAASRLLETEGIVIVPGFLNDQQLSSADGAIERVFRALAAAGDVENFEDDEVLVQSSHPVVKGYAALASHPKVVVTTRTGADEGMIDVFNVDRLAGEKRDILRAPFSGQGILSLVAEANDRLEAQNLNLYVNRSITHTRGFHVDSYIKSLKGFVYLSDVESLDDGPYCFVRRTHVDSIWRKANQKISELAVAKTEAPFIDVSMAVPVVAPRGSLILSDQAGIHRGIPQRTGAERRVLVMRYR